MKRSTLLIVGLLITLSLVGRAEFDAVAKSGQSSAPDDGARSRVCSLVTMKGNHGYSYSGIVMGSPIAAAGPIHFDGKGNLSATYDVNLGGSPVQGAFTGTYTVNADCTGTVKLDLPNFGVSSNGAFVILLNGKETFFTSTDPDVTVTGSTKRI